ncbi:MAG: universal stress protein [Caldilineaceae bacterium]|nr:universal stress protein [Caldilineaceae bacterium]
MNAAGEERTTESTTPEMGAESETATSAAATSEAEATAATIERILVALDASPHSLAALQAAAQLATLMQAELEGLYVEDINLLRLGRYSFVREVGSYSASLRPLDTRAIEREFQIQAARIRRAMAQTAVSANVRWSFHTTRGAVSTEVFTAAQDAAMLTLGRVGRSVGKRFGSTAQRALQGTRRPVLIAGEGGFVYPLIVFYDATPAGERALHLAVRLMRGRDDAFTLLVAPLSDESQADYESRVQTLVHQLEEQEIHCRAGSARPGNDLLNLLRDMDAGTLIVPIAHAAVINELSRSAIVVP